MSSFLRNFGSAMAASDTLSTITTMATRVPTPVEVGVSTTKIVTNATEVAAVVGPLVADRFAMNSTPST